MAKDKKKKSDDTGKPKKSFGERLTSAFFIVSAAAFLPSTMLLMAGMVPTMVALYVVGKNKRSKAFTVGSMNLAGCMPFLMDLWTRGHTIEKALEMLLNPLALVIMYSAAVVGYILYWIVVSVVSNVMHKKAVHDMKVLVDRQDNLVERWGIEVTGEVRLNDKGFAEDGEIERYEKEKAAREAEEAEEQKEAEEEAADEKGAT